MLGHLGGGGVSFNDQIKVAEMIIAGDGCIGARDRLLLITILEESQKQVLADREPQSVLRTGQGEAKEISIMSQTLLLRELELLIGLGQIYS
jgi:hypothetical protein